MDIGIIKALIKKYPVGAASIGLVLIMGGVLYVRNLSLSEQLESYNTQSEEAKKLAANITNSNQLEEHVRALAEANKTIDGRLVNPQDLAINLQYFYKIEADTGVKLLDARPVDARGGKSGAKGVFGAVQYNISLQGRYLQTLSFLRRLERGTYFCRVISANCGPAQSGQEKGTGETVMSLTVELLGRP